MVLFLLVREKVQSQGKGLLHQNSQKSRDVLFSTTAESKLQWKRETVLNSKISASQAFGRGKTTLLKYWMFSLKNCF